MKYFCLLLLLVAIIATATAVVSAVAGRATTTPKNFCNPISLKNGSRISFPNISQLVTTYPNMLQSGYNSGIFPWSFTLCSNEITPPYATSCNQFLARGNDYHPFCDLNLNQIVPSTPFYDEQRQQVVFKYGQVPPAKSKNQNHSYTATVYCGCDRNIPTFNMPSTTYHAALNSASNTVEFSFYGGSLQCCVDSQFPVPTLPPNPANNHCPPIEIPGGKYSFSKVNDLFNDFGNLTIVGTNSTYIKESFKRWRISLCDPTLTGTDPNFLWCPSEFEKNSFVSSNDCNFIAQKMTQPPKFTNEQTVYFAYQGMDLKMKTQWDLEFYCGCACSYHQDLSIPNHKVMIQEENNGQLIKAKFGVMSFSCCLNPA